MGYQKLFLEEFYLKILKVSVLINSTDGWSKGFTFNNLPRRIVSNIKKVNNSPIVSSFLLKIWKDLKGIFFLLKTFSVPVFCAFKIW